MEFKTKIDKILKVKNIALWKLAEVSGLHSTLEKAYKENREMRPTTTRKFLENVGINPRWWESNSGEILHGDLRADNVQKRPSSQWRVETDGDYFYIHRKAWQQMENSLKEAGEFLKIEKEANVELVKTNLELSRNITELTKILHGNT